MPPCTTWMIELIYLNASGISLVIANIFMLDVPGLVTLAVPDFVPLAITRIIPVPVTLLVADPVPFALACAIMGNCHFSGTVELLAQNCEEFLEFPLFLRDLWIL